MLFSIYVDDVFLMFEKKDHVKKFLKYMNSRHQNIKVTNKYQKSKEKFSKKVHERYHNLLKKEDDKRGQYTHEQ